MSLSSFSGTVIVISCILTRNMRWSLFCYITDQTLILIISYALLSWVFMFCLLLLFREIHFLVYSVRDTLYYRLSFISNVSSLILFIIIKICMLSTACYWTSSAPDITKKNYNFISSYIFNLTKWDSSFLGKINKYIEFCGYKPGVTKEVTGSWALFPNFSYAY